MTKSNFSGMIDRRQLVGMLSVSLVGVSIRPPFALAAADISIGMVLPFTGATGPYGPDMKKSADLVVKTINDAGGILGGRRLQLYRRLGDKRDDQRHGHPQAVGRQQSRDGRRILGKP